MQRPGVWFGDYIKQRCSRTEFSGLKGAGRNDLPLQLSVDEFGRRKTQAECDDVHLV
jgi:hypothetical protein